LVAREKKGRLEADLRTLNLETKSFSAERAKLADRHRQASDCLNALKVKIETVQRRKDELERARRELETHVRTVSLAFDKIKSRYEHLWESAVWDEIEPLPRKTVGDVVATLVDGCDKTLNELRVSGAPDSPTTIFEGKVRGFVDLESEVASLVKQLGDEKWTPKTGPVN